MATISNSLLFSPISLGFNKNHTIKRPHSHRPFIVRANKQEQERESSSSSITAEVSEKTDPSHEESTREGEEEREGQQELDWKSDEEFKKFMGSPSIEAAIKLEKKRTDRKLRELEREQNRISGNPIVWVFNRFARDSLTREKERLEKAEETFKALDLNKVPIE